MSRYVGMPDYMSIASFDDLEPATLLARRLTEEGYEAVARSDAGEQFWQHFNMHPRAHNHVMVQSGVAEEAMQKIKELDASEQLLAGAIICPQCGSTRIEYPQFSRWSPTGSLPAIAATVGLIDREFYCAACHYTWAPSEETGNHADSVTRAD